MKIEKSPDSMKGKRNRHMDEHEGAMSYEEYNGVYPKPTGDPGDVVTIKTSGKEEKFYLWVFHDEDEIDPTNPPNKRKRFHFEKEDEQERYEFFCGGWIQFYDEVIKRKEVEHKLFFYWDNPSPKGVAVYINDEKAVINTDKIMVVSYKMVTPPPALGDPPQVPPPPPPSAK